MFRVIFVATEVNIGPLNVYVNTEASNINPVPDHTAPPDIRVFELNKMINGR